MEPKKKRFSIGYIVAAILALFLIPSFLFGPHLENPAYSDFNMLLKHGKVSGLTLGSPTIIGTLAPTGLERLLPKDKIDELKRPGKGAHRFITARVDDLALVPDLEASKIRFTGHVENTWLSTPARLGAVHGTLLRPVGLSPRPCSSSERQAPTRLPRSRSSRDERTVARCSASTRFASMSLAPVMHPLVVTSTARATGVRPWLIRRRTF